MESFPKELKEDPVPYVAVTVLPGSTDVLNAETLVAAYRADLARSSERDRRIRVTVFDPAPLALKRATRRETFGLPGTPPPSASPSQPFTMSNSSSSSSSSPSLSSSSLLQLSTSGDIGTSTGAATGAETTTGTATTPPAAVGGIMRTNWFHKHLEVVPAVVLVLAAVRRADQWAATEAAVTAFSAAWRAVAAYRGIRFAFVLVVHGGDAPAALDERVALLRRRADVDARQVLVCAAPPEQLFALCRAAVVELADQHYRAEAKRLKQLARSLPRGAPFALPARLAVKAGFFAELRRDAGAALRHYTTAFARLTEAARLEARQPESLPLHEIKVVAWLVMYRMCALHFQHFHSLGEAVRCFALFANTFRDAYAVPAFHFAHLAWLAACYQDFAYLLLTNANAAIGNRGIMHPWSYFRAAAQLMRRRARAARQQCEPYKTHPAIVAARDALLAAGFVPVDAAHPHSQSQSQQQFATSSGSSIYEHPAAYYGQFSQWKTADGRDLGDDAHRTMAWELFFFDHNAATLALYERARVLLQAMPHSQRALLEVQTQIATQYADQGDWEQAKRCCDAVAPRYAAECWLDLVADTQSVARCCAMHLRNTEEFLANSLDLLRPAAPLEKSAKTAIQADMETVLSGPRASQDGSSSSSSETNSDNKRDVLAALVLDHSIVRRVAGTEGAADSDLLRVACRFLQPTVFVGDAATLEVTVTSFFPAPVIFATMRLFFTDARNDVVHRHTEQSLTEHLRFAPAVARVFRFAVRPSAVQELACRAVELTLGTRDDANVVFHWDNPAVAPTPDTDTPVSAAGSTEGIRGKDNNTAVGAGAVLHVQAKKSVVKLKARHAGPALCGELYEFVLQVRNDDAAPVADTRITCACRGGDAAFFLDAAGRKALPVLAVAAVPAHACFEQPVFIRVPREAAVLDVTVNVAFRTAAGAPGVTALQERVRVQAPFAVAVRAYTAPALQPIDMLGAGAHGKQPFYLCAHAQPTTPYALELAGVALDLTARAAKDAAAPALALVAHTTAPDFARAPLVLGPGARYAAWFLVRATHATQSVPHPGTLTFQCRRHRAASTGASTGDGATEEPSSSSAPLLTQTCELPAVRSSNAFVAVTRQCASSTPLGTAVTDHVRVENQSAAVRVVTIAVAPAPAAFMLAGPTSTTVALMPKAARTVALTFVPLATGTLLLPDLCITTADRQQIVCPRLSLFVTPPLPSSSSSSSS